MLPEFRAILGKGQRKHVSLPGFAVNGQPEAVGQERLETRPCLLAGHLQRRIGFGGDIVHF
jgi:hypothetical protein